MAINGGLFPYLAQSGPNPASFYWGSNPFSAPFNNVGAHLFNYPNAVFPFFNAASVNIKPPGNLFNNPNISGFFGNVSPFTNGGFMQQPINTSNFSLPFIQGGFGSFFV
jgi:hypothetical protein